jgi:heterotetrameric sarcosine oxidase gamma subunit
MVPISIRTGSGCVSEHSPIARSPIAVAPPASTVAGWAVSTRASAAPLTLSDQTPLAKVHVRAGEDGRVARALGVGRGRAARDGQGNLVVGAGPGEWLVLGPVGTAGALVERLEASTAPARAGGELVTIIDLSHGRALVRLTGDRAADVLAKVCSIALDDAVTPDGAALRTLVARLVTDIVRDDRDGTRSYLLHCETSSGQYLFDTLLDAGAEFDIDVDGFRP